MANTTKMTKRQVIEAMLNEEAISANEVYVEYLKHELELLDNRNKSRSKAKTAKDEANAELKELILAVLDVEVGKTITEVIKSDDTLNELSNQKVTALMKSLVNDGAVERHDDKKKATFTKVA